MDSLTISIQFELIAWGSRCISNKTIGQFLFSSFLRLLVSKYSYHGMVFYINTWPNVKLNIEIKKQNKLDKIPSKELKYSTWGKGKSSTQKCLGRGYYVGSLKGRKKYLRCTFHHGILVLNRTLTTSMKSAHCIELYIYYKRCVTTNTWHINLWTANDISLAT